MRAIASRDECASNAHAHSSVKPRFLLNEWLILILKLEQDS
jgi:hypothetical protein